MTGQGSEAVGSDITNPTKLVAESVLHFVLDSTGVTLTFEQVQEIWRVRQASKGVALTIQGWCK